MTWPHHRVCRLLLAATLIAGLPAPARGQEEGTPFEARGYPKEMASLASLTAQRCSKCHALTRVLDARHRGEEWLDVALLMKDKPKSGIGEAEAEKIGSFLAAWSTFDAPQKGEDGGGTAGGPGGALSLPKKAYAISQEVEIGSAAPLPFACSLEGWSVRVLDVRGVEGGGAAARVEVGGTEHELRLEPGAGGLPRATTARLKSWSVGRHTFALELTLASVAPAGGRERPAIRIAAAVTRAHAEEPERGAKRKRRRKGKGS